MVFLPLHHQEGYASIQLSIALYQVPISELPTGATQVGKAQWIHFLVNWAVPILVAFLTHFDSVYF